jgi:hypothetical protein
MTRALAAEPDHVVDCYAEGCCAHCGMAVGEEGQAVRHAYDHIDLPAIRPMVARVRIFGRRCPGCRRRVRGAAPARMPPGSPFGPSIVAMLAYLHHHHHHAVGTRMGWEWVLVSGSAVLHRIRPSRGRDVVTEVLGDRRPRCRVSDRWGAQQGHADTPAALLPRPCPARRPVRGGGR